MRRAILLLVLLAILGLLLAGCTNLSLQPKSNEVPATFMDYRRGGGLPLDFNKVVVKLDNGQTLVADCPFEFAVSDQGKARVMVKQNDDGSWVVMSVASKK